MIDYDSGYFGTAHIFRIRGSVIHKSFFWAVPNAIIAGAAHVLIYRLGLSQFLTTDKGITIGMGGYTMALGFLLVFRTREAYSRWWESITLLQTTRGEWFGAYSNLIAFCSHDGKRKIDVECFQHLLVRLMSLLYGTALDQVSTYERSTFDVIDLSGIDEDHLEFLSQQDEKLDIVLQWIQQLIVSKHREGVLDIAPPILSRVFQELSRGKVNITNARKISEFPFPYPYAQLLTVALLIQWLVTPVLMCILCEDAWWAAILAFTTNLFLWSINYVGEEIEEPYGNDENDLPLEAMQKDYNNALVQLLMQRSQSPPMFAYDESHRVLRVSAFRTAKARSNVECLMPGTSKEDRSTMKVLSEQDLPSESDPGKSFGSKRPSLTGRFSVNLGNLGVAQPSSSNARSLFGKKRADKKDRGFNCATHANLDWDLMSDPPERQVSTGSSRIAENVPEPSLRHEIEAPIISTAIEVSIPETTGIVITDCEQTKLHRKGPDESSECSM